MKADDITSIVQRTTKKWAKQRKCEERSSRARFSRSYIYSDRVNQSDVAFDVIPRAYAKASDNGRLPAHARQIFYAARKEIQDRTGRPLNSVYFTQNLLPTYMNRYSGTKDWWVVYDARGHLSEPHTGLVTPLGTIQVAQYLRDIQTHKAASPDFDDLLDIAYPTKGPKHRFGAILFIEKEGFNELFKEVKLAERYDLAIMSTKGQSVVAARRLVDELCHEDVPVLVLHDFDKEGFLISQTLTSVSEAAYSSDRVRYRFQHEINVIDLGLRLEDVQAWDLESESVRFKGEFDPDSIATREEQEFLRNNQRVELNAFTSRDFISWIEQKLEQHGIKKVIPDSDTLADAYRRAFQIRHVNRAVADIADEAAEKADDLIVPIDLDEQIRDALAETPEKPWDQVVAEILKSELPGDE